MQAFLHHPTAPALNVPGRRIAQICSRRRVPRHTAASRVLVSAVTDEAPPLDGPPASMPPPRRPEPSAPPPRPSAFGDGPSRQGYAPRPDRPRPPRRGAPRPERGSDRPPQRPAFVIDPDATYYTKCGACSAAYEIKPEMLGDRGKKVRCSVCGNDWFQRMDRLSVLKNTEGLKDYPVDEKERLMAEQSQARKDRRTRRNDGPSRYGGRERREGEYSRRGPRAGNAQHSVFIGNLPFSCSQERLEELIAAKINVNRVTIVKDATGRSKGFAFADVNSEEDVQFLVQAMNGTEVDGRSLTVRVGNKRY